MPRFCVAAAAVLLAIPAAGAADLSRPPVARAAVLVCADAYCGQRKYPDPFIADGWRGSDPRYDRQFDVRTWHRLRTMKVIYVTEPPGY